jgi:hypothetical protein
MARPSEKGHPGIKESGYAKNRDEARRESDPFDPVK